MAVLLALAFLSLWLWVRAAGERSWSTMEARIEELFKAAAARDAARPVLRGEPIPGDAWEHYAEAEAHATELGHRDEIIALINRRPGVSRPLIQRILTANRIALDAFRKGTRRSTATHAVGCGLEEKTHNLQVLMLVVSCQALLLQEEDRHREAAEVLVDLAQMGRDVGHNGTVVCAIMGTSYQLRAFNDLRETILSDSLTAEDFLNVERELESLDRNGIETEAVALNELAEWGTYFSEENLEFLIPWGRDDIEPPDTSSWRYGFSSRAMIAAAFHQLDSWTVRYASCGRNSWAEEQRVQAEIQSECEGLHNPIVRQMADDTMRYTGLPFKWIEYLRRGRAKLRILRIASRFRATGDVLQLEDPYGSTLLHARTGGALKIWSVGKDGIDDGGQVVWDRSDRPGEDIGLEVTR